jgi:hypothetical protein
LNDIVLMLWRFHLLKCRWPLDDRIPTLRELPQIIGDSVTRAQWEMQHNTRTVARPM